MARNRTLADGRKAPAFYIDIEADDAGLTASQFRVYARIVRRAGETKCFESVEHIAAGCRLEKKTVLQCLRDLMQANFIKKIKRPGRTSEYTLIDKSEWKLDRLNSRERRVTYTNQHPTLAMQPNPISTPSPIPISTPPTQPNQHPTKNTHEDIHSKIVPASPPTAPLGRVNCPKCKRSVPIMISAGHQVAPCLKCNIDVFAQQVETPETNPDTAKCIGFYRHRYVDLFGEEPRITKGKDWGIISGLVTTYGKVKVQRFIAAYFQSGDEKVVAAGYSIAFFSTRINSLIVAASPKSQPCRPEIVT